MDPDPDHGCCCFRQVANKPFRTLCEPAFRIEMFSHPCGSIIYKNGSCLIRQPFQSFRLKDQDLAILDIDQSFCFKIR